MTELFTDTVLNMMTTTAEPEDYTGEDGLLYPHRPLDRWRTLQSAESDQLCGKA